MKLHTHTDRGGHRQNSHLGFFRNARSIVERRILPATLVMFATYGTVLAADVTSTWNVASGNWSFAANWDPITNFPNNGALTFDGFLANNGTITLDQNITIQKYTQSNGTLTGSGNFTLTLNELMTWNGGTIGGNGTVVAKDGIALGGGSVKLLGDAGNAGRTLINNGTANLSGGNLQIVSSGGANPGSAVTNNDIFNVTDAADIVFLNFGGSQPSFTNTATGTFNKSGAATTTNINVPFTNSGTANVDSGTLQISGGGSSTGGSFSIDSGALLNFNASTYTLDAASSISGAGDILFSGGTVNHSGAYTITGITTIAGGVVNFLAGAPISISTLNLTSGTLGGSGVANITTATWTGGTMANTGTTTISGTLTMSGASLKSLGNGLNTGRTLIINGTANLSGGNLELFNSGGANPGSTVINNGTFNVTDAADIMLHNFGGGQPTFTNTATGTFNKSGEATTTIIDVLFTNDGTVNVDSGTLQIGRGGSSAGGSFSIDFGALLNFSFNTYTLDAASSISGAGEVLFSGGTVNHSGAYSITGVTTVAGGVVNFLGGNPVSMPILNFSSGTLGGSTALNVTTATWTGGMMGDTGITTISGTLTMSGASVKMLGSGGNSGRSLVNNGTTTLSGGENGDLNINNTSAVNPGTVFTNNGTFNAIDGADIISGGGGNTVFSNTAVGTFNKSGAATTTQVSVPFNNSGTVNVDSGTLQINNGGSSTGGTFSIDSGATLELNGNPYTLDAASSMNGAGNILFSGGIVNLSGAYAITGITSITGGTLNLLNTSPIAIPTLVFSAGVLGGSGVANITTATWTGGKMADTGTTTISGTLTISGPGTKTLGGGGDTGRTLINNGTVNLSGSLLQMYSSGGANPGAVLTNNGTFNVSGETDFVFGDIGGVQAVITNTAAGIFNKSGAATMTQVNVPFNNSGTVNVNSGTLEFTGQFTQSAGSLNLLGGSISGPAAIDIQGGLLTGNGTISDAVTHTGGTIAPGNSAGAIAILGNLTLGNGSNLSIELGGLTQGAEYDFLSEAGSTALTLDGTLTLSFISGFENTVTGSDIFTILTSNQTLLGAFDNIANGARLNVSNLPGSFQVNYGAGSPFGGGSVVLTDFLIPEPSAALSLALGFASLGLRRRRFGPSKLSGRMVDSL